MTQPVAGNTDFDNLPATTLAGGSGSSAGGSGLTAHNVDGWDITLLASNSVPDTVIEVDSGFFVSPGNTIDGITQGGSNLQALSVAADDGSVFTLSAVDVGISGLSNGQLSGTVLLVGYRNGSPVAGATLSQTVNDDGTVTTFNVSGNTAFQNIDSFRIETDGTYYLNFSIGLDNINATAFAASGPILTASGGISAFVEADNTGSRPVAVDSGLTLTDASASTIANAIVAITGNFHPGEDVLAFVNTSASTYGNITASYNSVTGSMVLVSAGATATVDGSSTLSAASITLGGTATLAAVAGGTPITLTQGGTLNANAVSGAATVSNFTFGNAIHLAGVAAPTGLATSVFTGSGTLAVGTTQGVNAYVSSDGAGGTTITPTSATIGVYRFFEQATGVQFYTTSANEAQSLIQTRSDFTYEGVGTSLSALVAGNGDPNAVAVYRFFDTRTGSHFYTTSTEERDQLAATRTDLVYETGSSFYEHATQQAGDTAVYRFFNSSNGTHFLPAAPPNGPACRPPARTWSPRASPFIKHPVPERPH